MVDTLTAVFKADIQNFINGASKVDRSFRGMHRVSVWAMARVGSAVADAGRKMLNFAKDAIQTGIEFEQSIADLRAVLPVLEQSGDSFDRLKDKIKELGSTTVFTATQAAEGAQLLAMAGLNVEEVYAALPATLQLATAGTLELSKSADIATNVMSGFGFEAEELQKVVDGLAFTANNSNTTIRGLGGGFSFLSATASALGVSFESSLSALAALGNVGIQNTRAGRNLASVLGELAGKGEALGLDIFKANGELKNFDGIMQAVADSGMTTRDIIDNFGEITSRTILALQASGGSIEELSENAKKLGLDVFDASGKLLDMEQVIDVIAESGLELSEVMPSAADGLKAFALQADASGINLEKIANIAEHAGVNVDVLTESVMGSKETFEGLGLTSASAVAAILELGEAGIEGAAASDLLNTALTQFSENAESAGVDIKDVSGNLNEFTQIMAELAEEGFTTEDVIKRFGEEAGQLFEIIQEEGAEGFRDLTEEVREFTGAAEGAGARMQDMKADTLSGDVKGLKSAFEGLKIELFDIGASDVLRKIVQGITELLREGTRFVSDNKEAIASFLTDLGQKIPPVIAMLKAQVAPAFEAIGKGIAGNANRLVEFVGNIANARDTIVSVLKGMVSAFAAVREVVLTVVETFAQLPSPIQKLIVAATGISIVMGPLLTLITGFVGGLGALTNILVPAIAGATGFGGAIAALATPVTILTAAIIGLAAAFATNFGGIRDKVVETFSKIAEKFNFASSEFNAFKTVLDGLWKSFEQIFELILDAVISTIGIVVNTIANGVKMIGDIFNLLGAIVTGFVTGDWSDALDALKSFAANTFTAIIEIFSGLGQFFVELGGNLVKGFGEGIAGAFNTAKQAVEGFANNIIGWFKGVLGISSPSTVFASFGGDVVQGLINGIQGLLQSARNTVTNFAHNVSGWFKSVLGIRSPSLEFLKAGESIVEGLVIGIKAKQGEASDAVKELAQKTIAAFDQQVAAVKANLELEIISPQDALAGLEQMKAILLEEVNALAEVGETGGAAFTEIASKVNALQTLINTITNDLQALADQQEKASQDAMEASEAEFRHRLALNEVSNKEYAKWLGQQLALNKDNVEKRRQLELEFKGLLDKTRDEILAEEEKAEEERLRLAREAEEDRQEAAKIAAEKRADLAKDLAEKQIRVEERLHEASLQLNQEGLQDYINTLQARAGELEKQRKTETEEYFKLQESLNEAEEVFSEQRVSLAMSEAKQKLAANKLSVDGYIKQLQALAQEEIFSVNQRIDIVRELADFKEDQGKQTLDVELGLLDKLLGAENLTGEEIKDIQEAIADFAIERYERRTVQSEKNLEEQLRFEIEVSQEQVALGKMTLEQHLAFLEQLLSNTKHTAEQRRLIENALADTIQELARENKDVWEKTSQTIVDNLERVADSLRDISPIASSVFDFLANTARNVISKLEELKGKAFGVADALGVIGEAAQSSSNTAISALGGLANAAANIASGNIIGGVVGAISSGISFIGSLFGGGSDKAKELREELERLRKEAANWAAQVGNDLKSVLGDFDTSRFLEGIIGGLPLEKIDDFVKKNIELILDFRKRFVESLKGVSEGFGKNFFDPLTGEFVDSSKNFLNFYSDFAGKFAGEVQRLQDQLAFAIKSGVSGGSFNISGLEEDLEEALRRLEGWAQEFKRAADFLGGSFSSSLSEALTNPNVSIAEAGNNLQDSFKKFVIQTIIDMAVQTALATGVVASRMADLTERIREAFSTGNWQGVRDAVGNIAGDLNNLFQDLAKNVGGALDEVFGSNLNSNVTVDSNTIESATKNISVNLNSQDVTDFKNSVQQLEFFEEDWSMSITSLTEKFDGFAMSVDQLALEFMPSLSTGINMFDSASTKFSNSVTMFDSSVRTFDTTINRDVISREAANREFAQSIKGFNQRIDRIDFASLRGKRGTT